MSALHRSETGASAEQRPHDPLRSADESYRYFRMRPAPGETAWIEYELDGPSSLSSAAVYWFDDRRFCRLPSAWRILYKDGDDWRPVSNHETYIVEKNTFNRVTFDPIRTTAIRLEVEASTTHYAAGDIGPPDAMFIREATDWREFGVLEWRVG